MKIDLTKEYKEYYKSPKKPQITQHNKGLYLAIEGKGEPAGKEFNEKVSTLYPVAYGVKKIYKSQDKDFGVSKLEGLWWVEKGKDARKVSRSEWHWKLMIRVPDYVKMSDFKKAVAIVISAKDLPLASSVTLEEFECGKCAEMLHLGPYSEEETTIDAIHEYILSSGHNLTGFHQEIYLSDPRKTAPEKMKTIIRQQVK